MASKMLSSSYVGFFGVRTKQRNRHGFCWGWSEEGELAGATKSSKANSINYHLLTIN